MKKESKHIKKPAFIDAQNFSVEQLYFLDSLTLKMDFPLHRHSFVELEYIAGGKGRNVVNGKEYMLSRGAVSLLMPWHVHELYSDKSEPLKIFKVSFRLDFLDRGSAFIKNINELITSSGDYAPVVTLADAEAQKFESLFSFALSESKAVGAFKDEATSAYVMELVIIFLRAAAKSDEGEFSIWQAVKMIQMQFNKKDISLKEIAEKFGYSESYMNKLFKEQVGLTFSELLQETRVRNAAYMLSYSHVSIEDISLLVGYQTRSGLYEVFEKVKGKSPAEYRRENAKSAAPTNTLNYSYNYTKVIYYLHSHHAEDISLDTIAEVFHYNKSYLSQLISNDGTTFADMLGEVRVYHACKYLLMSDVSVARAGEEAGFKSPETFYRTFKKFRGCTPTEYRKKNR